MDFASGYVVMSLVYHAGNPTDEDQFQHMVLLPIDKFLEAFADPQAMAEAVDKKANQVIREWFLLNGKPDTVGNRTQTERAFTLAEHSWKQYGKIPHRSLYELQFQTWGFTDLYNKIPSPPTMRQYDVKASMMSGSSKGRCGGDSGGRCKCAFFASIHVSQSLFFLSFSY